MKDARVIQQNIDAAEMCHCLLHHADNFIWVGQIRREDEGGIADLMRCFFEPFLPATDQSNLRAFTRESDCASAADAAARSGNDCDFAVKSGSHPGTSVDDTSLVSSRCPRGALCRGTCGR